MKRTNLSACTIANDDELPANFGHYQRSRRGWMEGKTMLAGWKCVVDDEWLVIRLGPAYPHINSRSLKNFSTPHFTASHCSSISLVALTTAAVSVGGARAFLAITQADVLHPYHISAEFKCLPVPNVSVPLHLQSRLCLTAIFHCLPRVRNYCHRCQHLPKTH